MLPVHLYMQGLFCQWPSLPSHCQGHFFGAQDSYCASSTSYGNSTQGTFAHPAEVFNLEKLFSVGAPSIWDV